MVEGIPKVYNALDVFVVAVHVISKYFNSATLFKGSV
jgi:hypothetical protein